MATTGSSREGSQPRRLPRLLPPTTGASSDETPRTDTSENNARQRRRTQQRLARQKTPDNEEELEPRPARQKDLPLPPRTEEGEDPQTNKRRKARRRVQSSSQLLPEPSLLQGFEDDIIVEPSAKRSDLIPSDQPFTSTFGGTTPSKSAPTPRVYVENKKTFSSMNKDAAAARVGDKSGTSPFSMAYKENYNFQQQTAEVLKRYTVQVAKQTHAFFQRLFLFIHGINAGYALWVCIFAYVFTQSTATNFFDTYKSIALITHLLFYLFLALCIVDILDRIDPVKFNRTVFFESISIQNCAIALIFYAVALIVNLVMMQTEDALRMNQYLPSTANATSDLANIAAGQGDQWKQLTAVRAAFILAGWFIVSMHVKKDRLSTMIKNTEENAFYQELNVEHTTVPLANRVNSP